MNAPSSRNRWQRTQWLPTLQGIRTYGVETKMRYGFSSWCHETLVIRKNSTGQKTHRLHFPPLGSNDNWPTASHSIHTLLVVDEGHDINVRILNPRIRFFSTPLFYPFVLRFQGYLERVPCCSKETLFKGLVLVCRRQGIIKWLLNTQLLGYTYVEWTLNHCDVLRILVRSGTTPPPKNIHKAVDMLIEFWFVLKRIV